MIPAIPKYKTKHFGVTEEEEDQSPANMIEEYRELLQMAQKDLKTLQEKRRKNEFGEHFRNAAVYGKVVYLGQIDGAHSLDAALDLMSQQHKCLRENIRNLAINITGHGNPTTIGTKSAIALTPDDPFTGLAPMVSDYISERIDLDKTRLQYYLLACNSGYVQYSNKGVDAKNDAGKEEITSSLLNNSYAGRFFQSLKKCAQEDGKEDVRIHVSGYRGYIGHDTNKMRASKSEEVTPGAKHGGLTDLECVRFIIGDSSSGEEVEVTIPKSYKFNVQNVVNAIDPDEAFKHRLSNSMQSSSSADVEYAQEAVVEDAEQDKAAERKKTIKNAVLIGIIFVQIIMILGLDKKLKEALQPRDSDDESDIDNYLLYDSDEDEESVAEEIGEGTMGNSRDELDVKQARQEALTTPTTLPKTSFAEKMSRIKGGQYNEI